MEITTTSDVSTSQKKNVAIFASGHGSNAEKIIRHFAGHSKIRVALIVTCSSKAGVIKHAQNFSIPLLVIEKEPFLSGEGYLPFLKNASIDFIVLAGFLWKVPSALIEAYPSKIINIHPALLPKFGGKGMYGDRVHGAVLAAGERNSGITIHYVDEHYDNGGIIFQATCPVEIEDTVDTLAARIHQLEHQFYPLIVEDCLRNG